MGEWEAVHLRVEKKVSMCNSTMEQNNKTHNFTCENIMNHIYEHVEPFFQMIRNNQSARNRWIHSIFQFSMYLHTHSCGASGRAK